MQITSDSSRSQCSYEVEPFPSLTFRVGRVAIELIFNVLIPALAVAVGANSDLVGDRIMAYCLVVYLFIRITTLFFDVLDIGRDMILPSSVDIAPLDRSLLSEDDPAPVEVYFGKDGDMGFRIGERLVRLGPLGVHSIPLEPRDRTFSAVDLKRLINPIISDHVFKKAERVFFAAVAKQLNWCISKGKLHTFWGAGLYRAKAAILPYEYRYFPALLSSLGLSTLPFPLWDPSRIQLSEGQSMLSSGLVYRVVHAALIEVNRLLKKYKQQSKAHIPGEGFELLSGVTPKRVWSLIANKRRGALL